MNKILLLAIIGITSLANVKAKTINFKVTNNSGQKILQLEYWLGSQTESLSPNLIYKTKGSLDTLKSKDLILDFHKRKRNTLLIKAYLIGGGYISQSYTIDKGEENPSLEIINIMRKVPTNEFERIKNKFTELRLDSSYVKASVVNGINSLIGSLVIYDSQGAELQKIDPKVLKSKISQTNLPNLKQKITGTFSSETTAKAGVNLPIVTLSSAFSTGDVANFTWEIENVGEYNWSSESGSSLAEMFLDLPQETKDVLVDLYESNKEINMRFIDKAFVIGRLEITTKKSKKINSEIELNASNFVTGNGNYKFVDDLTNSFVVNDIITQIKGYDVTHFLKTLYSKEKAKKPKETLAQDDIRVLLRYYEDLSELNPNEFQKTSNVNQIRRAILNLSEEEQKKLLLAEKQLIPENIDIQKLENQNLAPQ